MNNQWNRIHKRTKVPSESSFDIVKTVFGFCTLLSSHAMMHHSSFNIQDVGEGIVQEENGYEADEQRTDTGPAEPIIASAEQMTRPAESDSGKPVLPHCFGREDRKRDFRRSGEETPQRLAVWFMEKGRGLTS
jgi:hypothetical protein